MIYLSRNELIELLKNAGMSNFDVEIDDNRYWVVSSDLTLGELISLIDTLPIQIAYPIEMGKTYQGYASATFQEMLK